MSPYNVTKAAVISLSESIRNEVLDTNITVLCATPFFFQSNIVSHSKGDAEIIDRAKEVIHNSSWGAQQAAKKIIKAIHKKKETVRFPKEATILYLLKKWFSFGYRKLVKRLG